GRGTLGKTHLSLLVASAISELARWGRIPSFATVFRVRIGSGRSFFKSPCRSALASFVYPVSETVPQGWCLRLALKREYFDALYVSRQTSRSFGKPDAGTDGGDEQARRPGDQ